ncbi:WD40 repeat domain-containing protein [Okeania sp. SIO2B3]|uniref:WD40 repeat domain-containing protein n=1 Tax=Okeania sp. SIO2B3 TaxID=2607784 RepID=UPI0013C13DF3|nr:hypothetical protein [Okeania sp. SIO2B3]NET44740.1 hypothetical protein [Okeania sp. SIO2B3]
MLQNLETQGWNYLPGKSCIVLVAPDRSAANEMIEYAYEWLKAIANVWGEVVIRWNGCRRGFNSNTPITMMGESRKVDSLAVISDLIFAGRVDGTVQVWDLASKNLVTNFSGYHSDKVKSLAVTPDGKTLISGSADKTVKIWDFDF